MFNVRTIDLGIDGEALRYEESFAHDQSGLRGAGEIRAVKWPLTALAQILPGPYNAALEFSFRRTMRRLIYGADQ